MSTEGWLISAILREINHLAHNGMSRCWEAPASTDNWD